MKKILNWKYAFFCIYALCSLALISGVDNTYAAGNPFESNIKTDPTALVLGDVVPGSGVSSLSVEAGPRSYFNDRTVVDSIPFSDQVKYGIVYSDVWQQAIQDGRAFRARTSFHLNSGETRFFYAVSPDAETEIQLMVDVNVNFETEYTVWLEPRVSGGTSLRSGGLNPHVQVIGGYQPQYGGLFYDPSSVTTLGTLIPDATERIGQGGKQGGTSANKPSTIVSPLQALGFQFRAFFNGVIVHAEWIWKETPGGIVE